MSESSSCWFVANADVVDEDVVAELDEGLIRDLSLPNEPKHELSPGAEAREEAQPHAAHPHPHLHSKPIGII